jgi:uncharacterized 2Fe-2S/4Fe-4S cluster protein (DUF4445 family)
LLGGETFRDVPEEELPERVAREAGAVYFSLNKCDSDSLKKYAADGERVTVLVDGGELCGVAPGDTAGALLGAAVDVGTTSLNARLVDMSAGKVLGSVAAANPQGLFGADVASRINYVAEKQSGLEELRRRVVGRVCDMLIKLSADSGRSTDDISRIALVGNPTMVHLFLGIDPRAIAASPYIPAFTRGLKLSAAEAGVRAAPGARLEVLPSVAAYVGADAVAAAMRVRLRERGGPRLMIDLGTNAEIMLSDGERLWCCAAAAGPALEGAHIKCGMGAADGAIDRIDFTPSFGWTTIGGAAPAGLCGTGLLDAVAGLLDAGVIAPDGRLGAAPADSLPAQVRGRIRRGENGNEFALVRAGEGGAARDIALTQQDVREVQLAVGAIRAGVEILLGRAGVEPSKIEKVYLAGALGTYLRSGTALRIGLAPAVGAERIVFVGNAALDGGVEALVSAERGRDALALASSASYIELSAEPAFQDRFAALMRFPAGND